MGYILEVETIGISDRLDVEGEGKKERICDSLSEALMSGLLQCTSDTDYLDVDET